jgi:hypothetical protein
MKLKTRPLKVFRQLLALFALSLLAISCRDKVDLFQIERQGTLSFSTDNIASQHADDVNFYKGKEVLFYYDSSGHESYTRYLLEARGKDNAGADVILSIEIDFLIDQDYIGVYRPAYEYKLGGIYSLGLMNKDSLGNYKSYRLDPEFLAEDYLQIERQSPEEKLILGKFFARLVCEQNPAEKLTLYQGIFKDISYAK